MDVLSLGCDDRTQIKKFVLNAQQDLREFGKTRMCKNSLLDRLPSSSEERVQFIQRTVSFNSKSVFRKSLPPDEARFSSVSTPRVDSVDYESGLIEVILGHSISKAAH